jgi:hypothetical protein
VNDARHVRVGLQLATQPQNLDVNAAIEDILVYTGRVQEVFAADWSLRSIQERDKQRVLFLRHRHHISVSVGQASRAAVKLPIAEPTTALLRIPGRR